MLMWLYKIPFWLDISDTLLLSFALFPHFHHCLNLQLNIEWDGTVVCCNVSKPLFFLIISILLLLSTILTTQSRCISFFFHSHFTTHVFFMFHISFHVFDKATLESHAILLTFPSRLVSSTQSLL